MGLLFSTCSSEKIKGKNKLSRKKCIINCLEQYAFPKPISELVFEFSPYNIDGMADVILTGHHDKSIQCITALPDGRVAAGFNNGSIKLWNATKSTSIIKYEYISLNKHTDSVTSIISYCNKIISGSKDNRIIIWNLQNGSLHVMNYNNIISDIYIHPYTFFCDRIIFGKGNEVCKKALDDTYTDACVISSFRFNIKCVRAFSDGRYIVGLDNCNEVFLQNKQGLNVILNGHTNHVTCIEVLQDGRVCTGSLDNTIRIWNPETGDNVVTLQEHTDGVTCLKVMNDGRICSGSKDSTIKIWNDNICEITLRGHTSDVLGISFFRNQQIISCSSDGTIIVWK
jgi:WD40 repeat protein